MALGVAKSAPRGCHEGPRELQGVPWGRTCGSHSGQSAPIWQHFGPFGCYFGDLKIMKGKNRFACFFDVSGALGRPWVALRSSRGFSGVRSDL